MSFIDSLYGPEVEAALVSNTSSYNSMGSKIVKTMTMNEYVMSSHSIEVERIYKDKDLSSDKVFSTVKGAFKVLLNCILNKTCVENEGANGVGESAFSKLKKTLDILSLLSIDDSLFLEQIQDGDLISIIKMDHRETAFLSYTLLLRKGNQHFSKIFKHVDGFTNDQLILFLRNFQNKMLLTDVSFQDKREELLSRIVTKSDISFSSDLIRVIEKIDFEEDELRLYLESFCKKITSESTESSILFRNSINRLSIQNGITFKC
jgi:hypothetical protein